MAEKEDRVPISDEKLNEFVRLQKQLEDVEKELEDLEKANPGICQAHFANLTKQLFAENPRLYSFGWRQYTPSWNDGDTCYFSAHTGNPDINGITYENIVWGDDNDYEEDYDKMDEIPPPLTKEEAKSLANRVVDFLSSFRDTQFEHWFGDGMKITCTRKGVTIEYYDCGY